MVSACLNGVLGTIAVAMVETRPFNYVSVCFWKRATFSKKKLIFLWNQLTCICHSFLNFDFTKKVQRPTNRIRKTWKNCLMKNRCVDESVDFTKFSSKKRKDNIIFTKNCDTSLFSNSQWSCIWTFEAMASIASIMKYTFFFVWFYLTFIPRPPYRSTRLQKYVRSY